MSLPTVEVIDILKIIKRTISFPYPQICKHLVASDLLDLLERKGCPLNSTLVKAVIEANDDLALTLLGDI